jgi:hypothetical protein
MANSPKLMIVLYLIGFSWTYLFRKPFHTLATMLIAYLLWFLVIDSDHTLMAGAALDMSAIVLGIMLSLYTTDVLGILPFLPPITHEHARNIDSWTLFMKFQRVGIAGLCTTALALGWLFWHWQWAFMIVGLLFTVVIGFSFWSGYYEDRKRDFAYVVWLGLTLWQVLFFGAARQIDPSTGSIVWVVIITGGPVVLLSIASALQIHSPDVSIKNGQYIVLADMHVSASGHEILLPPTYVVPSPDGQPPRYVVPYGFDSADKEARVDDFSGSSMLAAK